MTDKYIEKTFLYLVAVSVFLHAALFLLIINLPQEKKVIRQEPYMVELQDLPPSPEPPAKVEKEIRRLGEERRRVARETAPKGEMERERIASIPKAPVPPAPAKPGGEVGAPPRPAERGEAPLKEKRGGDFFRKKEQVVPDLSQLFPSAEKLAKLEEGYRKKYKDVEQGDTRLIDTDDDVLSPYTRRLKAATEERWEVLAKNAFTSRGIAVFVLTIKRDGVIEDVRLVESSGLKLLEDIAMKSIRTASYVGPLPRKWKYDTLHIYYIFTVH